MTTSLLIDGGQSGCRVALARDGVIGAVETVSGLRRVGRAYDGLRALVDRHDADVVAAGLSGYAGEDLGLARAIVTNDAVTAYLGALGDAPGAVIVAGTGAIALAAAPDGRWARADGWGTLLGDDGGGYWIARRALALALRARDGRGGSPELLRRAEARYGDVIRAVYDAPDPTATIAAFASDVAAAARAGDETAASIWHEAGTELARTAAAALRAAGAAAGPAPAVTAGAGLAPVVSWSGGVFAAGDLILEPLRAELVRLVPGVELRPPRGDGIAGAARLLAGTRMFASLIHGGVS